MECAWESDTPLYELLVCAIKFAIGLTKKQTPCFWLHVCALGLSGFTGSGGSRGGSMGSTDPPF